MGIDFIITKERKFTTQRDAAFEEQLAAQNLLSLLPDAKVFASRCRLIGDQMPTVGDTVLLYKTEDAIKVLLLNRHIANVMTSDAGELINLMVASNADIISAQISEVRELTKICIVRIRNRT
ncbi:MAG: hypothetical protein JWM68_3491 [Verrucomicrobiales bacterium]|nr:hypothetical protein [Verrucomicrobiales bacterium]